MIPPHTVFLLQFAKHRPECTRKAVDTTVGVATCVAKKEPAERGASALRRLFSAAEALPTRG